MRWMLFRSIGLTGILLIFFTVSGQDAGTISGTVVDKSTHIELEGAEIILSELNKRSASDMWGKFSFKNVPEGMYKLKITHIGYESNERMISIMKGQQFNIIIEMLPAVKDLEGVEIKEKDPRGYTREKLPYIKSIALQSEIEETSVNDIGTYLRNIPNVSGIRKGGTVLDPVVRGFKYSQLNVQVNHGLKIEGGCPNRMDPAVAHIEIEDISHIEVLKGPYTLKYGPSFGGVINMITKVPEANEKFKVSVNGWLGYSSNPFGLKEYISVSGGNKKILFGLSGGYKSNGNYKAGNGEIFSAESNRYSFKGLLGYRINDNHIIMASYDQIYGFDVAFPALPMDMRSDDTKLISADYHGHNITEHLKSISLKYYRSYVEHIMDNKNRPFSDTVVAITTVQAINTGFRAEAGLSFDFGEIIAGADYENISKDGQRVKNVILQPMMPVFTEQIWNNALITNAGLFAEYKASFLSIDIIAAARLDLNKASSDDIEIEKMNNVIYFCNDNSSDFINFSYSLGLENRFSESFSLGFMFGHGVRSPDMVERFITLLPVGYDRYDYLGNPKLKPEKNNEIDLTARYNRSKIGAFELNGFYSSVKDYITGQIIPPSEQKPLSNGVLGVKEFYNASQASFFGFEFAYLSPVRYSLGVHITAAYTRARISEITRNIVNESGEVTGTEVIYDDPLSEIPPFETSINLTYKLFDSKLVPGIRLRIVSAQDNVSEAFYESTSPGFALAGLMIAYQHNSHLKLTAGVDNIFNENYYEHLNRQIIGSKSNFYEPGRNFYVNLIFNI